MTLAEAIQASFKKGKGRNFRRSNWPSLIYYSTVVGVEYIFAELPGTIFQLNVIGKPDEVKFAHVSDEDAVATNWVLV